MNEIERVEFELKVIDRLQRLCDQIFGAGTTLQLLGEGETWQGIADAKKRKRVNELFPRRARPAYRYHRKD